MHPRDDIVLASFFGRDKFLRNILELEKLSNKILEDKKQLQIDLDRLQEIVNALRQEIQRAM